MSMIYEDAARMSFDMDGISPRFVKTVIAGIRNEPLNPSLVFPSIGRRSPSKQKMSGPLVVNRYDDCSGTECTPVWRDPSDPTIYK